MLRIGLLALAIATVVGVANPSSAYIITTSGVEVLATPAGPGLWNITLETDRTIGYGGFNIPGATSFTPDPLTCDGVNLLCFALPGSTGQVVGLTVFTPTLLPNVGGPAYQLGVANAYLVTEINQTDVAANFGIAGFGDLSGTPLPFTGGFIPEPGTMLLLGAGLAGLALLRKSYG